MIEDQKHRVKEMRAEAKEEANSYQQQSELWSVCFRNIRGILSTDDCSRESLSHPSNEVQALFIQAYSDAQPFLSFVLTSG